MPFFEVTSKKKLAEVEAYFKRHQRASRKLLKLVREKYGADDYLVGGFHHLFACVVAEKCPGSAWCQARVADSPAKMSQQWRPRATKAGREISAEIDACGLPELQELFAIISPDDVMFRASYKYRKAKGGRPARFLFETRPTMFSGVYEPPRGIRRITDTKYEKV